jgi:preprotein translocase subunit SecY
MGGTGTGRGDKGIRMSLSDTLRLAWADPDLRQRLMFVLFIFGVYALGVHIPVPVPGLDPARFEDMMAASPILQMINMFGGGGLRRISIFALGLMPYITSSIIMQVLTQTTPAWKKELQEGGEYARRQQNRRTRALTLVLCLFQGYGLLAAMHGAGVLVGATWTWQVILPIMLFWTAGAMFVLWLGEQVSERGIGNGVSLMIFAGIIITLPSLFGIVGRALSEGVVNWLQVILVAALFLATTWFVVMFTISQRRIPIQHMRRQFGTKTAGGQTSYLPLSLNLAGVIPIIFAVSLVFMPSQVAMLTPEGTWIHNAFRFIERYMHPDFTRIEGIIAALLYMALIFFFTYFWTAIQYNVEDIANNLKRGGSYIPGVRPGKQTKDFLDAVISRITIVGALFLAIVALSQYAVPLFMPVHGLTMLFGTSLLIMISVALETMRQIEANILMKQYGAG